MRYMVSICTERWHVTVYRVPFSLKFYFFLIKQFIQNRHSILWTKEIRQELDNVLPGVTGYWLVNIFCITFHRIIKTSSLCATFSIDTLIINNSGNNDTCLLDRNAHEIWWIDIKFVEKYVADNQLILVWLVRFGIIVCKCNIWKLSAHR